MRKFYVLANVGVKMDQVIAAYPNELAAQYYCTSYRHHRIVTLDGFDGTDKANAKERKTIEKWEQK